MTQKAVSFAQVVAAETAQMMAVVVAWPLYERQHVDIFPTFASTIKFVFVTFKEGPRQNVSFAPSFRTQLFAWNLSTRNWPNNKNKHCTHDIRLLFVTMTMRVGSSNAALLRKQDKKEHGRERKRFCTFLILYSCIMSLSQTTSFLANTSVPISSTVDCLHEGWGMVHTAKDVSSFIQFIWHHPVPRGVASGNETSADPSFITANVSTFSSTSTHGHHRTHIGKTSGANIATNKARINTTMGWNETCYDMSAFRLFAVMSFQCFTVAIHIVYIVLTPMFIALVGYWLIIRPRCKQLRCAANTSVDIEMSDMVLPTPPPQYHPPWEMTSDQVQPSMAPALATAPLLTLHGTPADHTHGPTLFIVPSATTEAYSHDAIVGPQSNTLPTFYYTQPQETLSAGDASIHMLPFDYTVVSSSETSRFQSPV